jgi:hypothetical protein
VQTFGPVWLLRNSAGLLVANTPDCAQGLYRIYPSAPNLVSS